MSLLLLSGIEGLNLKASDREVKPPILKRATIIGSHTLLSGLRGTSLAPALQSQSIKEDGMREEAHSSSLRLQC